MGLSRAYSLCLVHYCPGGWLVGRMACLSAQELGRLPAAASLHAQDPDGQAGKLMAFSSCQNWAPEVLLALLQRRAISGECRSASCFDQSLARSCQLSAGPSQAYSPAVAIVSHHFTAQSTSTLQQGQKQAALVAARECRAQLRLQRLHGALGFLEVSLSAGTLLSPAGTLSAAG